MNTHASGFSDEGQPHQKRNIPMRIMKILDALTLEQKTTNYIPIIKEIRAIVTKDYQFSNVYHVNSLTVECLYYIEDFNKLSEIHDSSVWAISDMEAKKRNCFICVID